MEVYKNYKQYIQFKPEYASWKEERNKTDAQRLAYLKNNPVDEKTKQLDKKRGEIIIHAVNVMDEYSQSNAEDMEVLTEEIQGQVLGGIMLLGAGLGALAMTIKPLQGKWKNLVAQKPHLDELKAYIPSFIGAILSIPAYLPMSAWAAKKQVKASRQGRLEAINKDLSNPAVFAILNETQMQEAKNIAKTLPDEKDKEKGLKKDILGPIKMIKKLVKKDKEYENQKLEFDKKLKENEKNIGKELSQEQVLNAKKDMQLLNKVVEKIDIASQDYAENIELATNAATGLALGGGFLTKFLIDKTAALLKIKNTNISSAFGWGITLVTTMTMAITSTKLQKQGSRIGRFKAKQEFLKNPDSLIYTDDEKTKQIKDFEPIKQKKKENIFKFLVQASKDNKEYNKYKKTKGKEDKKLVKAIQQISLSQSQIQEAKNLQHNTFHTFNKVDEKSQTYSESVEALGDAIKNPIVLFFQLAAMGISVVMLSKKLNNKMSKMQLSKALNYTMLPAFTGIAGALIPSILLDVFITKEQKKASRIADMIALKELNDFRKYANYEAIPDTKSSTWPNETKSDSPKSLMEFLKPQNT